MRWKVPYDTGWTEYTIPMLKDRMSPHVKHAGKVLWVALVPEDTSDPSSYAEELERIAEIADEAAEPWLSRASVLEEVSRRYKQPVMSNAHRSELSMGIENVPLLGIENVPPRGRAARSRAAVMRRSLQAGRRRGRRRGGWPWRDRRGGACGSCCRGC